MVEDHLRRVPLAGILHQQMPNEILGFLRDGGPLALRKVVLALLNARKQLVLTGLTELASLPAAVRAATAVKGRVATQENVSDDAQRPQVAPKIYKLLVSSGKANILKYGTFCHTVTLRP